MTPIGFPISWPARNAPWFDVSSENPTPELGNPDAFFKNPIISKEYA
jgi:hypothetical protein